MYLNSTDCSAFFNRRQRYALWGLVALCFTVLYVVWMLKDRLCEVTISDGHMQMRAVVAYESKV